MRNRSLPICNHDQNGVTFDPSISVQLTETSRIGIRRAWAMYKISTSNAHRSTCIISNSVRAVRLVNNLKPHWVSRTPRTANSQTRKWNPCIRIVRKKLRVATASSWRWAREPITIPFSVHFSFSSTSSLLKSLNLVAPSASANKMYFPRELWTP